MTLELLLPTEPAVTSFPILIYGDSTVTGTLAIQHAKVSGLTVITTASPKNFDLVKSRGADVVFGYNEPGCTEKIRTYRKDSLRYVLDCISQESSYKICAAALSSNSSQELHCVTLLPMDTCPRKDVTPRAVLAYTTFVEEFFKLETNFPMLKDHYDLGVTCWKMNAKLLAEGKIKTHPRTVREGGLQGIPNGQALSLVTLDRSLCQHDDSISDVGEGKISACKLIYRTAKTPDIGGISGAAT